MSVQAVKIDSKRRAVVPAEVLAAAGIAEGSELIPHAEGPGRVVFETRAAMQARVRAKYRREGCSVSAQQAWAEYHDQETDQEEAGEGGASATPQSRR